VLTPILDIAAGAALQSREPVLTTIPVLLVLIPPFVSQAGALGGILSSRLSSKLQLGVIAPRSVPEAPAIVDGAVVTVLGLTVFAAIGIVASMLDGLLPGLEGGPAAVTLVGGTVLAGVLVMPVLLGIGYAIAVLTSRFELDPDDHAVPIITSVMDLTGVVVILASMSLVGVALGHP
jgi:mgtE-like transporter